MVVLHVKRGDQSLYLFETTTKSSIIHLVEYLVSIHNDKCRIERLCFEIEYLVKHGVCLPPKMQGLTSDQIQELRLRDEWADQNLKSLEYISNPDTMGVRNGFAPSIKYADILTKATAEAKTRMSQKMIDCKMCLSKENVHDTLAILEGAVKICYPMGLPPYDPVYLELSGKRDLSGTQASKEILDEKQTDLWWANKQLVADKTLGDYVGKNEKSTLIVKLQKKGYGAPAREPKLTEQQKKELMLAEFRRQEMLKKLDENDDDFHLDSEWADNCRMKRNMMGLKNITFK